MNGQQSDNNRTTIGQQTDNERRWSCNLLVMNARFSGEKRGVNTLGVPDKKVSVVYLLR